MLRINLEKRSSGDGFMYTKSYSSLRRDNSVPARTCDPSMEDQGIRVHSS
jgi:hypothetical protein